MEKSRNGEDYLLLLSPFMAFVSQFDNVTHCRQPILTPDPQKREGATKDIYMQVVIVAIFAGGEVVKAGFV